MGPVAAHVQRAGVLADDWLVRDLQTVDCGQADPGFVRVKIWPLDKLEAPF